MSLETIREVVSMWRTAESRRRGGESKAGGIFIEKQYWLSGRMVALIAQYPLTY